MKNILVTGGHGFIGHHVVKSLIETQYNVEVIDKNFTYGTIEPEYLNKIICERIVYIDSAYNFKLEDIRTCRILDRYDTVIHLAQYPRQFEVSCNVEDATSVLIKGLMNIFDQLKSLRHFIFISTSMVYGDFKANVTENSPLNPKSQYGVLRLMGEHFVKNYCLNHGIKYTIIRPSAVYGPRDTNIRVIGKLFNDAMNKKQLELRGGNQVLDFTHVQDLAKGIVSCVDNPNSYDQIFNMTRSDANLTTIAYAALIINKLTNNVIFPKELGRDMSYPERSILSIQKARDLLNYDPKINLMEGLEDTYRWIKSSSITQPSVI